MIEGFMYSISYRPYQLAHISWDCKPWGKQPVECSSARSLKHIGAEIALERAHTDADVEFDYSLSFHLSASISSTISEKLWKKDMKL